MTEGRHPIDPSALQKTIGRHRDGPPLDLLTRVLRIQCRRTGATGGVLIRFDDRNRSRIIAVYPPSAAAGAARSWVQNAEPSLMKVVKKGIPTVLPEFPPPSSAESTHEHLFLIPVKSGRKVRAVAVFLFPPQNHRKLRLSLEKLQTTSLLLNHLELKLHLERHRSATGRLHLSLDVVNAVNRHEKFASAAMALCNELAGKLDCRRVSLGFLEGRYIRVQAVSRTDAFRREMKLIQEIEATMEECFDQDLEVVFPPPPDAPYVSRAAERLARAHGPAAVLSVPLRQKGEAEAVVTLERSTDRPFGEVEEIEAVRLACDLCTPRLVELRQSNRWFGARAAAWGRSKIAAVLGPHNTWMKLAALGVFLLLVFSVFAKGEYRIEAPFLFESSVQQSVVAPFDSFLKTVSVEPGDAVIGNQTVLGELETADLRLKLAVLKAEQLKFRKERASSMRDGKIAEAQIAEAQVAKLAAEIRLIELHIGQSSLIAPITGRIVSEDLRRQLGAPVEAGDVLFEIAGIEKLRAELYVPEESIPQVRVGQSGELASVGHPERKIPFVVERINPMAEVVNQKNVFAVRAGLLENPEWMRPGMEGIAKISSGKRRYAWIWSHRFIDWLRMKLWL